ncbi:transcriptional regulator SplA domain-containing protein [Bacillus sp. B15-48]|uniref:transcriptional regulator SplA domain-containing protein n=1 Tax=Bacillus sp. B15-48 TaxID=1548601 RepID=UPI0023B31743|nr:transcriptional regulator SplA domain-containing protein [Bacillus sp. B15-48]MBM4761946.1 transcriptional regulator [Bacillus sp. B15-48]
MDIMDNSQMKPGDEVYVIYRNPHVPTVANIKAAEVVSHPKDPNALALFINETFHVIEDDDALFASETAATKAYEQLIDYE